MGKAHLTLMYISKNWNAVTKLNCDTQTTRYIRGLRDCYIVGPVKDFLDGLLTINPVAVPDKNARMDIMITLFISKVFAYIGYDDIFRLKNKLVAGHRQPNELQKFRRLALKEMKKYFGNNDKKGQKWIRNVTKHFGGTEVQWYNQEFDQAARQVNVTKGGWCLGVVLRWLGSKADGTAFWGKKGGIITSEHSTIRQIMLKQELEKSTEGSMYTSAQEKSLNGFLKAETTTMNIELGKKGLKASRPPTFHIGIGVNAKLPKFLSPDGSKIYLVGHMTCTGGGSHAIGSYIDDKKAIWFMDPLLGEVTFNNRMWFRYWFLEFIRYEDYRIESIICHQFK